MRVKRGVTAHQRHKKLRQAARGMGQARRASPRKAREANLKALSYAYRDRRNRKRDFRQLWITRLNAAAREHGLSYSRLTNGLKKANIKLDRKILAELAVREPKVLTEIIKTVKK